MSLRLSVRIAVTGASGVLGRGIVARLLSQGHDVVGLARHRPESWPSAADFVQGDIRDAAAVKRAVAGADVVAHCAWVVSPGADDQRNHHVNIGGTANVLEAMAQTGSRRIVFASSAHVYGGADAPKTEHDARTRYPRTACTRRGLNRCWPTRRRMGRDPLRTHPRPKCRQLVASTVGLPVFPTSRGCRSPFASGACRRRAAAVRPGDPGHRNRQWSGQSRRPR